MKRSMKCGPATDRVGPAALVDAQKRSGLPAASPIKPGIPRREGGVQP
jgi:hypothetical protein